MTFSKIYLSEIRGCDLPFHLPPCFQDTEIHHFMVIAGKVVFNLNTPNRPLLVCEYERLFLLASV